jgi:membrane-associated phospholipid phosphatase
MKLLLIVVLCGQLLEYALLYVFNGPSQNIINFFANNKYTFPDGRVLMAVASYGFLCFLIIRNRKKPWEGTVMLVITICICIGSGCSSIFFRNAYPVDVYAGYIFGGLWLSLNVILLEVVRILNDIDTEYNQ